MPARPARRSAILRRHPLGAAGGLLLPLLADAVEARDEPLTLGTSLAIGACVLAINLGTDLVYAVIDPRIRLA